MPAHYPISSVPEVGGRIPADSVHAVSVSLPRVSDVIGYEEKISETMSRIQSGYPRFVAHPYVTAIVDYFQNLSHSDRPCVVVSSDAAAEDLFSWSGYRGKVHCIEEDGIVAFPLPEDESLSSHLLSYIQHTGCLVSSRRAEDFLLARNLISSVQKEDRITEQPGQRVSEEMARLNAVPSKDAILSVSGMNSVYAAFRAMHELQKRKGRTVWIQLGWLYVDNIRIVEKFTEDPVVIYQMDSLESIKEALRTNKNVAGIITEVPTNPLLQTADLVELYEVAAESGCMVLSDISVGSSVCINAISHSDVVVESLTKFASGSGDVMMGAAIINPDSAFYSELRPLVERYVEAPYISDLERLAYRIQDYEGRMSRIDSSVKTIKSSLRNHPAVAQLFCADEGPCAANYLRIAKRSVSGEPYSGGMISLQIRGNMQSVYDSLDLLKGPSFGTDFTLVMLYLYLAHYELVSRPEGVQKLKSLGMDPGLFRVSVGLEDPETLLQRFEQSLAKA